MDVSRVWSGDLRWASEVKGEIGLWKRKAESGKLRSEFRAWYSSVFFVISFVAGLSPHLLLPGLAAQTLFNNTPSKLLTPKAPFLFPFLFSLLVLPFIFIKSIWSSQHINNQNTEKLERHEFCLLPRANNLERGV